MTGRYAFSLVEVLVATAILSMCMIPVIAFSQRGFAESSHTQQEILGRLLLIDFAERYKDCPIDELKAAAKTFAANSQYSDAYLIPLKSVVPGYLKGIERSLTVVENHKGTKGLHLVAFSVTYLRKGELKDVRRTLTLERIVHQCFVSGGP